MLAHILAIAVGLGGVSLYLAAFFFPEVHRKHDFFWSGIGCFYALVLWVDAGQISATELLGHTASIALLGWFGWQTLNLRRKRTPRDLQTPITDESWQAFGQEITDLGISWLKGTPLGRFLPQPAKTQQTNQPPSSGAIRASSLKQVDYEFVDDLLDGQPSAPRGTVSQVSPPEVPTPGFQESRPRPTNQSPAGSQHQKTSGSKSPLPKGSKPLKKPQTLLEKGLVLKDWLGEVFSATVKPKPKKPVIVIPPREPQARSSPEAQNSEPVSEDPYMEQAPSIMDMTATPSATPPAAIDENTGEQGNDAATEHANLEDAQGSHAEPSREPPEPPEAKSDAWDEIDNWSEIEAGITSQSTKDLENPNPSDYQVEDEETKD